MSHANGYYMQFWSNFFTIRCKNIQNAKICDFLYGMPRRKRKIIELTIPIDRHFSNISWHCYRNCTYSIFWCMYHSQTYYLRLNIRRLSDQTNTIGWALSLVAYLYKFITQPEGTFCPNSMSWWYGNFWTNLWIYHYETNNFFV